MHLRLALWTLLCCMSACDGATTEPLDVSCESDQACGARVCVADWMSAGADLEPMPLHCVEAEEGRAPGAACEQAEDCEHKLCLLAGACARACRDADDCNDGQRCQSVYARVDSERLATATACVDHVNLPEGSRVEMRELPAAFSGGTDQLVLPAFEPQTLYVVEHLDDRSWPIPASSSRCRPPLCGLALRTQAEPTEVLFARDQLSEDARGPDNPIPQGSHVSPLPVWIPNGTRVTPEARAYELEVESSQKGAARITSLARDARGSRLDLNVYYVGAARLKPEGTRGPPLLEAALEEVERIFAPADIYLGEVRQLTVPGTLAERGSQADEVSAGFAQLMSRYQVLPEFPELLRLSAGAANSALDVFLVADIQSTAGADVGGVAGGTPVAFGMHGGPGSGIAIASDMFIVPGRARELGRTLAHEIGHALGLFHTTEPNGVVFDPLSDTPACSLARDRDGSGSLDADECAAHGGDNLMFSTSDAGDALSEEQCEVLRRALILQ